MLESGVVVNARSTNLRRVLFDKARAIRFDDENKSELKKRPSVTRGQTSGTKYRSPRINKCGEFEAMRGCALVNSVRRC